MRENKEVEEGEDLSPETSHPMAIQLLPDAFLWDCTDENSPFGNDTGSDTLAFFRRWRQQYPGMHPFVFLDSLLESWQVINESWELTDSGQVQRLLELDEYSPLVRDDAVIAVAFGQILLDGLCADDLKERAMTALERQSLPVMIAFRGWTDAEERTVRLVRMQNVLGQVMDFQTMRWTQYSLPL